jgi:hypothetical protein
MSTFIVAGILIGFIIAICFILVGIHNKHNRTAMNNLLKHFSNLGRDNDLNFSSQEILRNSMFGIDGNRRKLLVVTREDNFFGSFIIDLDQVKNCSVQKTYRFIKSEHPKNQKTEPYLDKIALHFDLNSQSSAEIVFYRHLDHPIYEAVELEQKAKHWEAVLSNMQMPLKQRA